MKRALGNLEIGFNSNGHANYKEYPIGNGKRVPVDVRTGCWVWFTTNKDVFFDNRQHEGNRHYNWTPTRDDVTAEYRVGDHQGHHPPRATIENTYSIKVGSGSSERKRKKKSKSKSKTKAGRKTGRKSSSRRRK